MIDLLLTIQDEDTLKELFNLTYAFLKSPTKTIPKPQKLSTNATDLEFTVKQLVATIRLYCLRDLTKDELQARFAHLTPELQQFAVLTINARREEVLEAQIEDVNSRTNPLITSFDWDIRWIMGNSSLPGQRRQIANLFLNCRHPSGDEDILQVEMKRNDVENLINLLESSL